MVDGFDDRSLEPTLPGEGPTLDDAAHPRSGRDPAGAEGEVPDRIGRFIVVRRLGVGGMGAVFEAHDPALERPVALKLLHGDAHPGEHTRLRREAQALARLSHPHVVQVFEAGTHGPRAYIAMELVDGVSLDVWLAATPRRTGEIVEAFVQAGEGLMAAHAAGFVHRDFKPSNAMMGTDGRVRVLDFGLARADPTSLSQEEPPEAPATEPPASTWAHDLTRAGALLGTPAYMSPEQLCAKPVTEASDQFAFCVALHQALYGRHPFADEGGGRTLLMSNVIEGRLQPSPPSRAVPGRIRRVVLRGLAHAPEDRWPTMAHLLDALRHAQRPSRWRRALGLGAPVLAVLAGAWWLMGTQQADPIAAACTSAEVRLEAAWGAASRDRVEQALLGTDLPYAEATWAAVHTRLDDYAARWRATHASACETITEGHEPSPRLEAQLACLERLRRALGARVEVLAAADAEVAEQAVAAVGGLPPAEACVDAPDAPPAISLAADPERAARHEALEQQLERTAALRSAGKYAEALASAEQADEDARALAHPPAEARAALELGLAQQQTGRLEPAVASLERAYFLAHEHDDSEPARRAAVGLVDVVGLERQDYDRGLEWARHAEVEAERCRDPMAMVEVLAARGFVRMQRGELEPALADMQAALAAVRTRAVVDPLEEAEILVDLGIVQRRLHRTGEAIRSQEQALAATEAALGPAHPGVAKVLRNLAAAYLSGKREEEAEAAARRSLAIEEASFGPRSARSAVTLNNLGMVLERRGRLAEAEAALQRSIEISESVGAQPHTLALSIANLALMQHWQGRYREAADNHRKAIARFEEAGLDQHPDLAFKLALYAGTLEALHELDEADVVLRRALGLIERVPSEHASYELQIHVTFASVSAARGRWADAIDHAEKALALEGQTRIPSSHRAQALFALARAQWAAGPEGHAQAIESARKAERASAKLEPIHAPLRTEITAWLGEHASAEPPQADPTSMSQAP